MRAEPPGPASASDLLRELLVGAGMAASIRHRGGSVFQRTMETGSLKTVL